jgi:Uncharacterized conserved protein
MAAFDRDRWNDLIRSGTFKCHNPDAVTGISRLVEWCKKKNIEVDFSRKDNEWLPLKRRIVINMSSNVEIQLCFLLHECGHILIETNSPHKTKMRWNHGYTTTNKGAKRKVRHKIEVLDEELEAWYRGRILADRLKIRLNDDKFHDCKATACLTYARWLLGD